MNKVQLEFQILNNKLEKLFQKLSKYSNEDLNKKVVEDKWSINENIYHLILAEKGTEKYIRTKTSYPDTLVGVNILSRIKSFILESFLKLGVSYKGPAIVTKNFPDYFDFKELKKDWIDSRKSFLEYTQTLNDEILSKGIFRHAIIGRMDIYMTLHFFKFHFDHHKKIIHKLESKL
jgi:hypothetical protein